jgi:hypothetical protein
MKVKIAWILFLGMCIMGNHNTTKAISSVKATNAPQTQTLQVRTHINIINAVSAVKQGGTGIITIKGAPNTLYNIKTSYKIEDKTISVIQWRNTDKTGVATFNWIVSKETIAGTYPATISGGGDILSTSHTVIQ